ncbi:unnamed protein product [Boreogadus saida]
MVDQCENVCSFYKPVLTGINHLRNILGKIAASGKAPSHKWSPQEVRTLITFRTTNDAKFLRCKTGLIEVGEPEETLQGPEESQNGIRDRWG